MVDGEGGHGGTVETVPALPYKVDNVDAEPSGRAAAEAAAEVANTELERRLALKEESERAKEAVRDAEALTFRPRGNYLLVRLRVTPKTAGGILLPDAKQEIPGHGEVVAVGPGVSRRSEWADVPIQKAQLCVRSRNALQEFGIKTLGEADVVSDNDLLSNRNFGYTSLSELRRVVRDHKDASTPGINIGDRVFFSRYVGATLEFPDGVADARYRVMSEDEVYGSWGKAP